MLLLVAIVGAVVLGRRRTSRCSLSRSFFSAVLFTIGVVGVLTRRNAIIIFMCVELMLNAVNLTFVAFAQVYGVGGAGVRGLRHDGGGGRSGGRARDHHRDLPAPADGQSREHQSPQRLMLLQRSGVGSAHPLSGTIAEWVWLLPAAAVRRFRDQRLLSLAARSSGRPIRDTPAPSARRTAHAEAHGHRTPRQRRRSATTITPCARHTLAIVTSIVGPGVLLLSFVLAVAIFLAMRGVTIAKRRSSRRYFSWMPVGDLQIDAAFQLDQLSMVMMLVITGVGTLIHIFSVGYMQDDPGYPRYFAYLNLFVFFMLVLVLGASYPVLFVGWEGVGLCSYLLIGFWFSDKANADAGKKAFIVNRIGDFGFLVAMFLLFANFGALDFVGVCAAAPSSWRSAARWSRRSACSCFWAAPARARRSRSTSGCRTRWPARRRCPR